MQRVDKVLSTRCAKFFEPIKGMKMFEKLDDWTRKTPFLGFFRAIFLPVADARQIILNALPAGRGYAPSRPFSAFCLLPATRRQFFCGARHRMKVEKPRLRRPERGPYRGKKCYVNLKKCYVNTRCGGLRRAAYQVRCRRRTGPERRKKGLQFPEIRDILLHNSVKKSAQTQH